MQLHMMRLLLCSVMVLPLDCLLASFAHCCQVLLVEHSLLIELALRWNAVAELVLWH